MSVNYNELLYEKLEKEYNIFISHMKLHTPERVIDYAYEITFKKEFLSHFEFSELPQSHAKALYDLKYPLNELYRQWLSNDLSLTDLIDATVETTIQAILNSTDG